MPSVIVASVGSCGKGWDYWQEQCQELEGDLQCLDPDDQEYWTVLEVYSAAVAEREQASAGVVIGEDD